MANLGTLDFDVRLNDQTKEQARQIKENLLANLSIDFNKDSFNKMVNNLRTTLSNEKFEINIQANTDAARQAIQGTLNQLGGGGGVKSPLSVDLSGLDGVAAIQAKLLNLDRDLMVAKANLKDYKDAWKAAEAAFGKSSTQAKQASLEYRRQKEVVADLNRQIKVLKQDKKELEFATKQVAKAEKETAEAAKQAAKAQKEAAKAEKERHDTHVRLNGEIMKGVRVSADLKEAFTSLYSVHMLREFLSNIIEIGGQLEKQRVSMGAILGDTAKANTLFEQIKGLAVRSPFGVVELDQYTKQLAAYGFEYNELYDMIKRLADISAGAGQDISRLTLALGHVRSEGALSGYTLRQFAMNNIPMLKMLSEYYTALEKQRVSTAQVRERISRKEVSYEDVIEQIRRLTDEGGMFFNMQEKIADTVAAKWKNLRDAFSIMYGELAESQIGDILKGTASALTSMAKNWQQMLVAISSVATVFGTIKIYSMLLSAALVYQRNKLVANTAATNAQTAASLRMAAGMTEAALSGKNLSVILNMIGASLKNLMLNPALWWTVGIEAAAALFMHFKLKADEAEKTMENIYNTANEGYKNLHQFTQEMEKVDVGNMSDAEFAQGIKEFIQQIKDYAPNSKQILEEANAIDNLKERYEYLRKEIQNLEGAYRNLTEVGKMLVAANDSTDGYFDDSFIENVKDYQEAVDETDKSLEKLLQHQAKLSVALDYASKSDEGFASAAQGKSIKEQIELLNEFPVALEKFKSVLAGTASATYRIFNDYLIRLKDASGKTKDAMQEDMDAYADWFNGDAVSKWGEKWKEDGMIVQSVMAGMKQQLEENGISTKIIKETLDYIFGKKWKLDIDFGAAGDDFGSEDGDDDNPSNTDEFLKAMQKRIKAIQDARKEYEALLKLGMSSDQALNRIAFMGVSDEDVLGYKEAIQKLAKQLGSGTAERKDYQKELGKYFLDIDKTAMQEQINADKEALKKAVEEIQNYIKEQTSKYSLFNSLLDTTGDENFAANAFKNGQIWDKMADDMRTKLEGMMKSAITDWEMDDSLAEKVFGKDTPALKLYQEIVKRIGDNWNESLKDVANSMKSIQTDEEKIANLERQINEWEKDTSGIDRSAQIEQARREINDLKSALFATLPVYDQIFGDTAYRSIASIKEGIRQMNEIISNAKESPDKKHVNSSYIDTAGVKQDVTLTISEFRRLREQGDKLFDAWKDKSPFSNLFESFKRIKLVLGTKGLDPEFEAKEWAKFASSLAECADVVGDLAGQFADMFDSLGNEGMASAMEDVQAGMNSISNIGKGFAEGGVFGGAIAAAGEVVGWIGRIAGAHDKKLDKAIENSQREVKELQNAYKNLEWEIGRQLTAITKEQTQKLLDSLATQRRELEKQRELEAEKKKKDNDKLIDYDQQIEELKQQMRDFYQQMAEDMYGINLDSWAGQIADAITDAFAKGEDAVSAFNDTVADIMNNVVKNIIKIRVVKPAMEELQNFLFGNNGIATLNSEGGVNITVDEATQLVKQLEALKGKIDTGRTVYDAVADAMKALGISPSGESSKTSSGLSKGIQGTTEETSNLLASYLNAVRADVSVIRMILESGGAMGDSPMAQIQLQQLQMIASNTMQTAQNTQSIELIYDILRMNVNNVNQFHIA